LFSQNLQQKDDVTIKAFPENSPPCITAFWYKIDAPPMKIELGSEVLVKVEVFKEKLIINKIFYHQN
jgi:hypothetical protein